MEEEKEGEDEEEEEEEDTDAPNTSWESRRAPERGLSAAEQPPQEPAWDQSLQSTVPRSRPAGKLQDTRK